MSTDVRDHYGMESGPEGYSMPSARRVEGNVYIKAWHGGVLITALQMLSKDHLTAEAGGNWRIVSCNVNYLEATGPFAVDVEPVIIRRGRRTAVIETRVLQRGRLVCIALIQFQAR